MINNLRLTPRRTRLWIIALFMMVNTIVAFGQTTYYSKSSATDFNDVNSWGTATDGTGTLPSSISSADNFVIQNAAVLSLSNTVDVRKLTIASGSLTIGAHMLTVAIPAQNNTTFEITGGHLIMNGGTLNVNGNFRITSTGRLTQTAGDINVDGNNAGIALTSVASGTNIVNFTVGTATNVSLTGGTFTIVDPHVGTTSTFETSITPVAGVAAAATHTFRFGNGISTDNGGTNGFQFYSWAGTGIFRFGNLVLETVTAGNNRFLYCSGTYYNIVVTGDLTINSGAELRNLGTAATAMTAVAGNINVNSGGTYTSAGTTYMGNAVAATGTSFTLSASSNAQSINGPGTFRNANSATPSATLASLTINNSNVLGVTNNTSLTLSGTLTLTSGVLHTSAINTLRLGTATAAGTLSGGSATAYIEGPFMRTFAASRTASGTYTATTLFPLGKGGAYLPAWFDPSTSSGGPVVMSGEAFNSNSGSPGSGIISLGTNRWEGVPASGAANLTGAFLQLGHSSITSAQSILQAASASGSYELTPASSTFATGTPNTVRTATQIPAASLTGFISYGEPLPCAMPSAPFNFVVSYKNNTGFTGSFSPAVPDPSGYLVVRYPAAASPTHPSNNTTYAAAAALGAGTVVGTYTATTFTQTGLTANTTYDYYVYSFNKTASCAGPVYNTGALTGSVTTCAASVGTAAAASAVDVTTSSFTARWSRSSTVGATYEFDLSTSSTFASFVPGYQALPVIDTFVNISSLNVATTYYYRVRAVNGTCYSAASSTITVQTLCNTVATFSENFALVATPALPACWIKVSTTGSVSTQTADASSVPNCLYMYSSSASDATVLSLPPVSNAGAGTHWLVLKARANATVGGVIQVGYLTVPNNAASFVSVQSFTASALTYQTFSIDLGTAPGLNTTLALRHTGSPAYSVLIDDVTWDLKPACLNPTVATTIVTGSTTATVRWSKLTPAPAGGYEIYVSASNTPPTISTPATGYSSVDTFYAASSLTPATKHYAWVRSNCTSSGYSNWSVADSFFTLCDPLTVLPYIENFNSTAAGSLPLCTGRENLNNDAAIWNTVATPATPVGYTGNVLRYNYNTNNAANDWFFTAPLHLTAGTSYRLKFKYSNNDPDFTEKLQVWYGSGATNTAMSTMLYDNNAITGNRIDSTFRDFVPPATGTYYIGFKAYSTADQWLLYVDDISLNLSPTCIDPAIASTIVTGSSTATVRWVKPATAPAGGYEIYVSTSATPPAGGATPTGYSAVDSFYQVSGLPTATKHYAWVRSNCLTDGVSNWSVVDSFTTYCATAPLPYIENFNSVTVGSYPACTAIENKNNDLFTWTTVAAPANPTGFSGNVLRYTYNEFQTANDWFFTAPVSLTAGTSYRLKFNFSNAAGYPERLKVMYGTAQNSGLMTTQLFDSTINNAAIGSAVIDFTPAATGVYFLGFQAYSTADQFYLYLDNINLDLTPTCFEPVIAKTIVQGTSNIVARWKHASPSPSSGYEVFLGTSNTAPTSASTATHFAPADTFVAISGLPASTKHYVWVRSNCASGGYSVWSTVDSFTTECNPVSAITEDFATVTVPALPACWNKVSTTGSAVTQAADASSAPNCLNINSSSTTNIAVVSLPALTNAGANTHWLTLKARANVTAGGVIQVGYLTNPNDASSFVTVQSFTATSLTYQNYSVNLGTAPGAYTTIALRHTGSPANSVLIDDVKWELKPACMDPVIAKSIVTGANTAVARWNTINPAPASGFDIFVSTTNAAPTGASNPTHFAPVDTFVLISGLPSATKHYVWVRSNCSGAGYSNWSAVDSFTTFCDPVPLPYLEDFNSTTIGTLPSCTQTENLNNDGGIWNTIAAPATPVGYTGNVLQYNYNTANAANDWFFTAPVSLTAGTSYRLKFNYGNNSGTFIEKLQVWYGTGATNTAMSVMLFDNNNVTGNSFRSASMDFVAASTGTFHIGFKAYSNANQWMMYLDNISLDLSPSCFEPVIAKTIIQGASNTARWNRIPNAPSNGYELFVATTNTPPNSGSTATHFSPVDSFLSISGLPASTKHYVWVRANCGSGGHSIWSAVDSFTTECAPVTTLNEDFSLITVPALPSCWNKVSTTGAVSTQAANPSSAPNCLYLYSGSATDIAVLALAPVSNAGAGTHWLTLKARANVTVGGVIQVGYLTNSGDASSFVLVQSFTASSLTYQNYSIDLGTLPGANTTIALRHTGSPANSVLIDDVKWEPKPACMDPMIATSILTGATSATVRWVRLMTPPLNGYDVYVSTSNVAPTGATLPTHIAVTDTFVALSGLPGMTKHFAWVRSNCAGLGSSNWSLADSFSTSLLVNSFPYLQDFETNSGAWTSGVVTGTVNEWALGTPAKTVISSAHSGTQAWITRLTGNYSINANAAVTSPVFDFSGHTANPILRFYHKFEIEEDYDAGVVEISINGGTWTRLDSNAGTGANNNTANSHAWYNNSSDDGNVTPFKFSGETIASNYASATNGWIQSATYLTGAAGQSNVRVRFRFNADALYGFEGWAVDDIEILASPVAPSTTSSSVIATSNNNSTSLSWTSGNGAGRIVVARLQSIPAVAPANFMLYTGRAFNASGKDSTGTGNYIVYNGTGSSANVTGLAQGTAYAFDVYEYNGKYMHVNFNATPASANSTTTPVTLVSFDGVNSNGNAELSWVTASERNNAGFEVERSTDGKQFEKAGFVKGAGNSSVRLRYAFTDVKPFIATGSAKLYYRLKQVDANNQYEYSRVIQVTETGYSEFNVTAFPVPFQAELGLNISSLEQGEGAVTVTDVQGKVVYEQAVSITGSNNHISLSGLGELQAGVYFVKVVQNTQSKVIRVVKN